MDLAGIVNAIKIPKHPLQKVGRYGEKNNPGKDLLNQILDNVVR